ncbi:Hypothetical predicted protein [Paramuricea clavata]|uniref:Uncharacterized protein n=1 Tax=Paramuricea clavata TaxID=317549 RepID=A0A7D9L6K2_PARCT|nr:Hypothetical predicted protein [Paramuricea clavata]
MADEGRTRIVEFSNQTESGMISRAIIALCIFVKGNFHKNAINRTKNIETEYFTVYLLLAYLEDNFTAAWDYVNMPYRKIISLH